MLKPVMGMYCTYLVDFQSDIIYGIKMSRNRKLIESILNNPRDVRLSDAIRAAELIGFTECGGKGSHRALARPGEPMQLNFQELPGGYAKPYQVRQLIKMIDLYWETEISQFEDDNHDAERKRDE